MEKKLTKKEFLARCVNAYDMGLSVNEILRHLERAYDAIFRLEGGQIQYFTEFLVNEQERTQHFSNNMQLANDKLGYNVIQLLAILTHPCQKCAVNPEAWHTRSAFCPHREKDKPLGRVTEVKTTEKGLAIKVRLTRHGRKVRKEFSNG